ncbi:hypothetical protein ACJ72_07066, partial [Emergomyces africanus]
MTDSDNTQQGGQQVDSYNTLNPNGQDSSWPSRYFPSSLTSRYAASKPSIPSSSSTIFRARGSKMDKTNSRRANNSNNNDNNISRPPVSVKRKLSDSTTRTPTRNTDTPIPTIIHPDTSLNPSSLSSPSHFSPTRARPHSARRHSQRKSILKVSTAAEAGGNDELYGRHTSQSDTRDNTSRNAILTLNYTRSLDDIAH